MRRGLRCNSLSNLARKNHNKAYRKPQDTLVPVRSNCVELSNLPPLPGQLRSLKFSNVLPGTSENIVMTHSNFPTGPGSTINPQHPSIRMRPRDFPAFRSSLFTLKAYPYAVLHPHYNQTYPFSPRESQTYHSITRLPFGLLFLSSKKDMHNSSVIRSTVKRRVQEAIRLVVTRGASVDASGRIIFGDARPNDYILKGWVYLLYPSIELLRTPWSNLLSQVRSALAYLKEKNEDRALEWDRLSRSTTGRIPSRDRTVATHLNLNKLEKGKHTKQTFDPRAPLDMFPDSAVRRDRLGHKLDTADPPRSVQASRSARVFLIGRIFDKQGTGSRS